MAKQQQRSAGHLIQRIARRERTSPIPVTTQKVRLRDGTQGEVQTLSLSDADVPDRTYFGEVCSAKYDNEALSLAFAQSKLGQAQLRSLVIISMTPNAAAQFLRSLEEMRNPSLEDIAKLSNISPQPLSSFPTDEPEQTASLIANVVAVAISGRETCMDFYHANAFTHLTVRETKQMFLEPVVRVNIRTQSMLSLVRRLQELRGDFPSDAMAFEEAIHDAR
jgi:transcriptional regulator with XRE-family HTH domain